MGYFGYYSLKQIEAELSLTVYENYPSFATQYVFGRKEYPDDTCLQKIFEDYFSEEKNRIIDNADFNRLMPLGKCNRNSPDPTLAFNSYAQPREFMSGHYFSSPVCIGHHLVEDIHRDNIDLFLACLLRNYGKSGGYSVLLEAGTGVGKTFAMAQEIAPKLGMCLECEVHMLIPTLSLLGQAKKDYGIDISGEGERFSGPGTHAGLRGSIYNYAADIPTYSVINGERHPNILIIDEAHCLQLEQFRKPVLDHIIKKAKEILDAGGIVIAMTASTETISATIPYNNDTGYDLLFKIFRVSSTKSFAKETKDGVEPAKYPLYTYTDLIRKPNNDVKIVDSVPVEKIDVIYKNETDSIVTSLKDLILQYVKGENRKVIAEYNNTDLLIQLKGILAKHGIKAEVCSASNKEKIPGSEAEYENKVYNDIINSSTIDFSAVDVVLTTKLLEYGTSISSIKYTGTTEEDLGQLKHSITTIFVVDRRTNLSLEAFEQFSGRVRFFHEKASLLMIEPRRREHGHAADLEYRTEQTFIRIKNSAADLSVPEERLSYINSINLLDFAPDFVPTKDFAFSAENISTKILETLQAFYKGLMYDRDTFEKIVKERFVQKNVTFTTLEGSSEPVSASQFDTTTEQKDRVRAAVEELISIGADELRSKEADEKKRKLKEALFEAARASLTSEAVRIVDMVMVIQDIGANEKSKVPIQLSKDAVVTKVTELLTDESKGSKRTVKRFERKCEAAAFEVLRGYCGNKLAAVIKEYAPLLGRQVSDNDMRRFKEDCMDCIPRDMEESERLKRLMELLLASEKLQRIFRLFSAIRMLICTPALVSKLFTYTEDQICQLQRIYQNYTFSHHPELILGNSTRSGVAFNAILGKEAYILVEGNNAEYEGLSSWKNKRITMSIVDRIYNEVLCPSLMKSGNKYNASIDSERLNILRTFAAVFTFTREKYPDGKGYIVLGDLRKTYPKSFDTIIHLTFKHTYDNPKDDIIAMFEDEFLPFAAGKFGLTLVEYPGDDNYEYKCHLAIFRADDLVAFVDCNDNGYIKGGHCPEIEYVLPDDGCSHEEYNKYVITQEVYNRIKSLDDPSRDALPIVLEYSTGTT
ncbi:MAG: hypothetical protein K6E34_09260 [Lachnospiraceae bacterium]|nr:hypothetical protein [Lachnospiraceae bacterium]